MPLDLSQLNRRIEKLEALRELAMDVEASTWISEMMQSSSSKANSAPEAAAEPIPPVVVEAAMETRIPQHGPEWWRQAIHAAAQ